MKSQEQELIVAIRQKCLDCCGGMRKEVERCRIEKCPLHKYRIADAKPRAAKGRESQITIEQYMRGGAAT